MLAYKTTEHVYQALKQRLKTQTFRGNGTVELQGCQFIADMPYIVPNTINQAYQDAEIEWYETADRRVSKLFEIYGQEVKIWKDIADEYTGEVNSNYGWCIYSSERGNQYNNVLVTLQQDPMSRQACMYYTTPMMHAIAGKDHTCTYAVQYFLNYEQDTFGRAYLDAHVYMRSNDAVFGYNNDYAWQRHVLAKLASDLGALQGDIIWNAGSMHVYERHYDRLLGEQMEMNI